MRRPLVEQTSTYYKTFPVSTGSGGVSAPFERTRSQRGRLVFEVGAGFLIINAPRRQALQGRSYGEIFLDIRFGNLADKGAFSRDDFHQPFFFENSERLPYGGSADAELFTELELDKQ